MELIPGETYRTILGKLVLLEVFGDGTVSMISCDDFEQHPSVPDSLECGRCNRHIVDVRDIRQSSTIPIKRFTNIKRHGKYD